MTKRPTLRAGMTPPTGEATQAAAAAKELQRRQQDQAMSAQDRNVTERAK
jgi:hypothetical protein